jgi:hypothetical protein
MPVPSSFYRKLSSFEVSRFYLEYAGITKKIGVLVISKCVQYISYILYSSLAEMQEGRCPYYESKPGMRPLLERCMSKQKFIRQFIN